MLRESTLKVFVVLWIDGGKSACGMSVQGQLEVSVIHNNKDTFIAIIQLFQTNKATSK